MIDILQPGAFKVDLEFSVQIKLNMFSLILTTLKNQITSIQVSTED